ncbi:MAG: RluA family pseudouridine synthase [Chloroflexi bacterium]|nr:MAG: RluA family pseudouridine synthase [Chloroflexota bacterium]MBL1193377.1 RluA family pseudouridine synthase [Chloroflexota bacterium]NOH10669.1 RluA family pseudouridine synthase [Chloroflexota bacterium]
MSEQRITLDFASKDAQRLDLFLVDRLPDYSRSRLQSLIKAGHVVVDGAVTQKTGYKLDRDAQIEVVIPPVQVTDLVPENIPLDIIFENSDVLVVNKAAGMVVHPSPGHETGTLVHAALAHAPDLLGVGGVLRPGVVHRLDRDTSGVIILAKSDKAHQFLQDQFRERTTNKRYLTLVDGAPPTPEGRVEAAIGRERNSRKKMAVVPLNKGRDAISEYQTLQSFEQHTLLEVHPHTGRTHQIRVHMAFLNCPVVGDNLYGRRKTTLRIKRQFLHAARLEIQLPGEADTRAFEATLPSDLQHALDVLQRQSPN